MYFPSSIRSAVNRRTKQEDRHTHKHTQEDSQSPSWKEWVAVKERPSSLYDEYWTGRWLMWLVSLRSSCSVIIIISFSKMRLMIMTTRSTKVIYTALDRLLFPFFLSFHHPSSDHPDSLSQLPPEAVVRFILLILVLLLCNRPLNGSSCRCWVFLFRSVSWLFYCIELTVHSLDVSGDLSLPPSIPSFNDSEWMTSLSSADRKRMRRYSFLHALRNPLPLIPILSLHLLMLVLPSNFLPCLTDLFVVTSSSIQSLYPKSKKAFHANKPTVMRFVDVYLSSACGMIASSLCMITSYHEKNTTSGKIDRSARRSIFIQNIQSWLEMIVPFTLHYNLS